MSLTPFPFEAVLFEASAFATVGLSVGITPELPADAQLVIVVLMLLGRVGPSTVASALALLERRQRYELPEERMMGQRIAHLVSVGRTADVNKFAALD